MYYLLLLILKIADMKIARVLWGITQSVLDEIPNRPIFDNEIVVVWGKENNQFLIERGYETLLLSEYPSDPEFTGVIKQFAHKLLALSIIENMYDEYFFVDWDVLKVKELDDEFYKNLRDGNDIQCPLYSYPIDYAKQVYSVLKKENKIDMHREYVIEQHTGLNLYSWKKDIDFIVPCFCFFYSRKKGVCKELLDIARMKNMKANIEEFSLFDYSNCSLDHYIEKYEPLIMRGKNHNTKRVEWMNSSIERTNSYIDSKMIKNEYLLHQTD